MTSARERKRKERERKRADADRAWAKVAATKRGNAAFTERFLDSLTNEQKSALVALGVPAEEVWG